MKDRLSFVVAGVVFAVLVVIWLRTAPVGTGTGPVVLPAFSLTPTLPITQTEAGPAQDTFAIQYQGQSPSPELIGFLAELQAAGRVSAVDAESVPSRIFVRGEEGVLLPLRELPVVTAVGRPGAGAEDSGPNQPAGNRLQDLAAGPPPADGTSPSLPALGEPAAISGGLASGGANDVAISRISVSATGVITGVVTAGDGGAPISDTLVIAYQSTPYVNLSTLTDVTGHYSLSLPSGSYRVTFVPPDYHLAERYNDVPYDRTDLVSLVAVADGAVTADINASLAPGAQITGRVTDEDTGAPLGNVDVYAVVPGKLNSPSANGRTDASGVYTTAPGLPPDSYRVRFTDASGAHATEYSADAYRPGLASLVAVTSTNRSGLDVALGGAAYIGGTITGSGPLSDTVVYAYYGDEVTTAQMTTTNASGIFRLAGLGPVTYKLRFYDPTGLHLAEYYDDKPSWAGADPISVTVGLTTSISAQLGPAGVISGVVTAGDSGLPLSNVYVSASDWATGIFKGSSTTDASGAYRIGGLATSSYMLRFSDNAGIYLDEYFDDKPGSTGADPVGVAVGMTTTVDAVLMPGGRIAGRVVDASSGAGIAGVWINAYRLDGSGSASGTSDAGGYYATRALNTGVYRVLFDPPKPYWGELYDNFKPYANFTAVTVTAPLTTTGLDAALTKGYLITGTVTGSGPLANVWVYAYQGANNYGVPSAGTAADGTYRLGPLEPAQYRLYFSPPDLHAGEWYDDSGSYAGAKVLSLAGDAPNVDAALGQGGRITGTVTGPDGAPLPLVSVAVYPVGASSSVVSVQTDSRGQYATSRGLPAGSYQVLFTPPAGYRSEWYDDQATRATSTAISVTAGVTTTNVSAQLTATGGASGPTGAITGTVTSADRGRPLAAWVYAYDSTGTAAKSVYASGGAFSLTGLPPSTYRLWFGPPYPYASTYYNGKPSLATADLVTVTAGLTTTDVNQVVPLGGVITGVVGGSGGIPGVSVSIGVWASGPFFYYSQTHTGVDGAYRLDGLPAGGYKVQFSPPPPFIGEYYDNAATYNQALTVTVALSATTPNINVTLAAGGVITGRITAADTGGGLPVAIAGIIPTVGSSSSATADMDGRYSSGGLPPGDYRVRFSGSWPAGYLSQWYNDGQIITLPGAGVIPDISAALARGGSISGWTYAASTGLPLGAWGTVRNASTGYNTYWYGNNWGFYQALGLASGTYKLSFSSNGYMTQWYQNATSFASALPVVVYAPDDTPNIDIYLRSINYAYLPVVIRGR